MTKGHWSSHNETAASAWWQQNADWWSEIKKTNHNTHHPENFPSNRCGTIDTDDEAAGWLRSTDLHCIISAAPEGHEKQPTAYDALRNKYTSLMGASYLANHPYENAAQSPIFKQQNIPSTNNLDTIVFHCQKWDQKSTNWNLRIWKRQLLKSQQLTPEQMDQMKPRLEIKEEYQLLYAWTRHTKYYLASFKLISQKTVWISHWKNAFVSFHRWTIELFESNLDWPYGWIYRWSVENSFSLTLLK